MDSSTARTEIRRSVAVRRTRPPVVRASHLSAAAAVSRQSFSLAHHSHSVPRHLSAPIPNARSLRFRKRRRDPLRDQRTVQRNPPNVLPAHPTPPNPPNPPSQTPAHRRVSPPRHVPGPSFALVAKSGAGTQRSRRRQDTLTRHGTPAPPPGILQIPAAPGLDVVKISRLASRALRLAGLVAGLGLTALAANQRSQAARNQAQRTMASSPSGGLGHLDATTGRTVVFCHACHNEWYEDERGQELCPNCGSDIIELVRFL